MVEMKINIFFVAVLCFAFACGVFVPPRPGHKKHLLGAEQCTWGPGYWCQNLTAAADCHAVKHCIQTDWIHRELPPDQSDICQLCKDMVKQARDQLESNETQELIKEVFEGTCALIHIKPIVKECDKICDNYIPDLIDTLASEMNPQVVCAVAGLCNSEKIHKLLEEAGEQPSTQVSTVTLNTCDGCHKVVDIIEDKFNKMSRDDFLQNLLQFCGKFGSFSDGCSNLVITYFTEIYNHLQDHLNSNEICLMSGECSSNFHDHRARVEITPNSHIGYVPVSNEDNLPCDLCQQLVTHLKDLLVANTTELEFKQVLEGLCKQTGQFSAECLQLVDEYYQEVYDFLVNNLNPNEVCQEIGICPSSKDKDIPLIAPLLSTENAQKMQELFSEKKKLVHINVNSDMTDVKVLPKIEQLPEVDIEQQLPIDLLVPPHTQIMYNKEVCEVCELVLHYLQVTLTEPVTEDKIKQELDRACKILPNSVNATCVQFVNDYEPALMAILVQEIDPSTVCPLIRACPSSNSDVEIFMEAKSDSKCPLCLVAVTKLESMLSNNKSESEIKEALKKVCKALPKTFDSDCEWFVDQYTDRLVEMLLADFTPTEVCVALHLCNDTTPAKPLPNIVVKQIGGNIETNVIPDNTINGHVMVGNKMVFVKNKQLKHDSSKPECVLCEFVMKEIQDQLKDNKTDAEIESLVKNICKIMPSSVKAECNDFIDQYADTVIQLLIAALEPSDICAYIGLCGSEIEAIRVEILDCPICEMAVSMMEKILSNPNIDHNIEHVLEKTCRGLPKKYVSKCVQIVDTYGDQMIDLIIHGAGKDICKKFGYCNSIQSEVVID